jgi:hypothetical protein
MQLDIYSAKYNRASSNLELTYKSDSNIPVFFKGTITPITSEEELPRLGDVDPIFIAPNDYKTVSYPDFTFQSDKLSLEVFTLFGETPAALEKILEKTIEVEIVNVIDGCDISIEGIKYSKPKEAFYIKLKNVGNVDCWADVELKDVLIDRRSETLGAEGSIQISKGKSKNIIVEQAMTDADLEDNSFVEVIAYYGEREDSLIKTIRGKFELNIETISFATIGLITIILIVIIAILVLIFMLKRRRDEEDM